MASLNKKTSTNSQVSGAKPAKAKKIKANKPDILRQAELITDSEEFLNLFGIDHISIDRMNSWGGSSYNTRYIYQVGQKRATGEYEIVPVKNNPGIRELCFDRRLDTFKGSSYSASARNEVYTVNPTVAYVGKDGTVWISTITLKIVGPLWGNYDHGKREYVQIPLAMEDQVFVREFKLCEKLMFNVKTLQNEAELLDIIRSVNTYAYQFVIQDHVEPVVYLMAPQLEILYKAGYEFAEQFFGGRASVSQVDCFNRLCQRGSKPSEIFKTSKAVYKVLGAHEIEMDVWDTYRKLDKFGRISQDTIRQSYEHAMPVKDLNIINTILAQKYSGKPIFDWDTLYHYLTRLDKFEAIGNSEALLLIRDYLNMCRQLGMRPRIDGDSLKREHDVAARLCRNMRNEKLAKDMRPACEKLAKYDYTEGVYLIRTIKNFDDLLSEATQQHSCLVSYGEDIAKERSKIFVMREVARPEKSLITVELSPDNRSITQALIAYNKQIRNKSQREFLDRWLKYVRDVDRYSA